MSKKFQRTKEDFICEKCGFSVQGNGYTNHCPRCLWSKHVDINPGDRQEKCRGLMEPIGIQSRGEEYIIIHYCQKCRVVKKNKTSRADDFSIILQLSSCPVRRC